MKDYFKDHVVNSVGSFFSPKSCTHCSQHLGTSSFYRWEGWWYGRVPRDSRSLDLWVPILSTLKEALLRGPSMPHWETPLLNWASSHATSSLLKIKSRDCLFPSLWNTEWSLPELYPMFCPTKALLLASCASSSRWPWRVSYGTETKWDMRTAPYSFSDNS